MSFEGSLESFAIAEIFQLIATQAKTGVLEISSEDGVSVVRFVKGDLFDAMPAKKAPDDFIGTMLVKAGYITPKQLEYALSMQEKNLRRLGDTLIRMGAIRTSEFQNILTLQRRELAFRLLRTKRGNYKFTQMEVDFEEGVDTLINVSAILMEGSRQIDEWPGVFARIPSDKLILRKVKSLSEDERAELGEEILRILGLVDGERTVREIINRSRMGEFDAWDTLARFYDDGVIDIVRQDKVKKERIRRRRRKALVPGRLKDLVAAAILTVCALSLLSYTSEWKIWTTLDYHKLWGDAVRQYAPLEERAQRWGERRNTELP
ncbi:MAG: hypothetical protein C0608_10375 [Deltaproteobacteria bacterium]|nr:MAG: hypothetical protein C0608_10375 [Deltaproteobacteria bacterium]